MDPYSQFPEAQQPMPPRPSLAGILGNNSYRRGPPKGGNSPSSGGGYTPQAHSSRSPLFVKSNHQGMSQGDIGSGGRSPNWARGRRSGLNQNSNSGRHSNFGNNKNGPNLVPSPPPSPLSVIGSITSDPLQFSETNMDWTKLNIFRTRLCDRLTQTRTCHMANRCLFSHDISWPRRTPFLPRATALTLRYIPVWCPRLSWPPLMGLCDSMGKISWTSMDPNWDSRMAHSSCVRGDNCPFVHNLEEFIYHPEVYKTRSCCLANDDNFDESLNGNCVALCPWYFCPFAHDIYEVRDLRAARYAWHLPPQIVDNHFVARTQGFDEIELGIIDFVRKSPNGSLDLYTSANSPLRKLAHYRVPPVFRPLSGSSLESLVASALHKEIVFDDLLYFTVVASLMNLLLYPVENFYVPTLLSLQCAVLHFQMGLPRAANLDCLALLNEHDKQAPESRAGLSMNGASPRNRAQSPMLSFEQLSSSAGVSPSPVFASPQLARPASSGRWATEATPQGGGLQLPALPSAADCEAADSSGRVSSLRHANSPSTGRSGLTNDDSVAGAGSSLSAEQQFQSLLELLQPDELMRVVEIMTNNTQQTSSNANTSEQGAWSPGSTVATPCGGSGSGSEHPVTSNTSKAVDSSTTQTRPEEPESDAQ